MEWAIGGTLFLAALYLFLIAPGRRGKDFSGLLHVMYAHRGLFSNENGVPENSLPAFRKAVEAGYGIELDVQLTRDGQLVVFHDGDLARMCGVQGQLCGVPYAQLSQYALLGTDERIPLFSQVLALVAGRVPIIVELKPYGDIAALSRKVHEALSRYKGPFGVESFHPLAMRWFKRNAPRLIRGQLVTGRLWQKGSFFRRAALKYLLVNALSRPDFIACDIRTDRNISMTLMRVLFKPKLVAWTVQTEEEQAWAAKKYDAQIFEGYTPER